MKGPRNVPVIINELSIPPYRITETFELFIIFWSKKKLIITRNLNYLKKRQYNSLEIVMI